MSFQRNSIQTKASTSTKAGKKTRHVDVIKHYVPKNSVLEKTEQFPEILDDADSDEDKFKNTRDKPNVRKRRTIKFSSAFDVPNLKSKFSLISSNPKEDKLPLRSNTYTCFSTSSAKQQHSRNLSTSSLNKYEPSKKICLVNKSLRKRNDFHKESRHYTSPVFNYPVRFSRSNSSSSTTVDNELENYVENEMFIKANHLKNKKREFETKNQILDSVKEMKDINGVVTNEIKVTVSPKNNYCKVDELKREINNAKCKKLLSYGDSTNRTFKNQHMPVNKRDVNNMNVLARRRTITELKTEIAEFRNKGFFVFNFNVKKNYNNMDVNAGCKAENFRNSTSSPSNNTSTSSSTPNCTAVRKPLKSKIKMKKSHDKYRDPSQISHNKNSKPKASHVCASNDFIKVNFQDDGSLRVEPTTFANWVSSEQETSGLGTSICTHMCQEDLGLRRGNNYDKIKFEDPLLITLV